MDKIVLYYISVYAIITGAVLFVCTHLCTVLIHKFCDRRIGSVAAKIKPYFANAALIFYFIGLSFPILQCLNKWFLS